MHTIFYQVSSIVYYYKNGNIIKTKGIWNIYGGKC